LTAEDETKPKQDIKERCKAWCEGVKGEKEYSTVIMNMLHLTVSLVPFPCAAFLHYSFRSWRRRV
jgi:hypothetical protein